MTRDEVVFIVTGANMAGYMEHANKIAIDDDDQLTSFLLKEYDEWSEKYLDDRLSEYDMFWNCYIERRLMEEYCR